MTHPGGGSGGSGPGGGGGTGPGRIVAPLTTEQRADNYRRQTGRTALTPKQRRRADHKASRYAVKTSANNRPGAGAVSVDVAAPAHTAA